MIVQGIGRLETATGLGDNADDMIQSMFRPPIWFLTRLFRAFGRPLLDVFVATDGPTVVGTGMALWMTNTAYVAGMATRPEYRGRGIASRILAMLSSDARRRRRPWMALDVESENATAIGVYLKAGYREIGQYSWFVRPGAPATSGPVPADVRPMARSDRTTVSAALDAARSETYRAVFPATARTLTHNEFLMKGPGCQSGTWLKRASNGTTCVLRTYFTPKRSLGGYFLMIAGAEPPAEELHGIVDAASAWMESLHPKSCLAVAPDPHGTVAAVLEQFGFARVVGSKTMVRETPT